MRTRIEAGIGGVLAAAAAIAAGELVAGLLPGGRSLVIVVGDAAIDRVPAPVKDLAIAWFGTADKIALLVGIGLVLAGVGAVAGLVARRRPLAGAAIVVGLGAVGAVASVGGAQGAGPVVALLPAVAATIAGVAALLLLLGRTAPHAAAAHDDAAAHDGPAHTDPADAGPEAATTRTGLDRRGFLRAAAVVTVAAGAAGATGRWLQQQGSAAASRAAVVLGRAGAPLPDLPAGVDLGVDGVARFVTPNRSFYRIDTALEIPQADLTTWRLRVAGMVDRTLELSYDELMGRELVEADITLTCVSNEVGGGLVGNARWLGVRLADLLEEAGVDPGATQLVGRSLDGFVCGFPVEAALDGREAIVAVGMNGEPLPLEHGFPARLVVPGLYGYVSATKWLSEIELTTFEEVDHYWVTRGWALEAPIKTQSRIDVPKDFANVSPGPVAIAGVAWAQTKGIERVEVRVDDGDWVEARLGEVPNVDTWRQWVLEWDATPGQHRLRVRATDATGEVQTEERAQPIPDGASGHQQVLVTVT